MFEDFPSPDGIY